jgi:hypothetical protein
MWDCIPGHNSWSSAYSVLSVLLQLQGEQTLIKLAKKHLHGWRPPAISSAISFAFALPFTPST